MGVSSLGYSGAMAHALMQRAEDGPSGAASGPYSAARFQVELVHLARQSRSFSAADCLVAGWRSVPVDFVGAVRALVAVHTSCRVASSSRELGISSSRVLRRARPRCRRSSSCSRLHWRRSGQCSATVGSFEIRTGLMFEIAVHCTSSFAPMVFRAGVPRMNLAALHCHLGSCFVDVGALHEEFDKVGLQYGPGYQTLEQVWGGRHTTRRSAPRALFTPGQARSHSRT